MMKKIIFLTMSMLMGMTVSAQAPLDKKEMKRLRNLIRKPQTRAPLPRLMCDDRSCVDELYDLSEWDAQTARLKADSIQKRHEENQFIREHEQWAGPYLLKSLKYYRAVQQIEREEMRYDLYAKECRIMAKNREADQRPVPKGELLSVSYGSSGMSYHPDLPFTVTTAEGDSALVTYSFRDLHFKADKKCLDRFREAIISERLYQLHGNYDFRSWDLPDIPKERMLDGQRWTFEARFSDGTVIHSSGMLSSGMNVGVIPKIYFDTVFPYSPAYRERKAREKESQGGH